MREVFDFLALGGPVIVILGVLSVIALALFIERVLATQVRRVLPARLLEVLRQQLERGNLREARALAESSDASIAIIAEAAIRRAGRERDVIRDVVADAGRRAVANLERNIGGIGSIASVAPLLGLLGTITGMIATFQQVDLAVTETGQVSPGAFAAGIWEALITTAAGLIIAIPTYAAYKYLLGRVDRLALALEEAAAEIAELVHEASGAAPPEKEDSACEGATPAVEGA